MTKELPFDLAGGWHRHPLAKGADRIIATLTRSGYHTLVAGGSIRDFLLGRNPKDIDLATDTPPEVIEQLFPKTVPIGKEFGIIAVQESGHQYEVATFRKESGSEKYRRPRAVTWADSQTDASRRDFTINALFYDPVSQEIIDHIGGQADLSARLIRFVGHPAQRVQEDALRILRAVRLKNNLDFQYDGATYQALKKFGHLLLEISQERIRDELNLMWEDSHRAQSLRDLAALELLQYLLPEIDALRGVPQPREFHQEGDVFAHTVLSVEALPSSAPTFLVWAVLFHDAGKPATIHYPEDPEDRIRFNDHRTVGAKIARKAGQRLKFPNYEVETIVWLVDHHMNLKGIETMREAKQRQYLLDPRFKWLLELHHADAAGTVPQDLSLYQEVTALYTKYLARWQEEQARGAPDLLLSGHDLIQTFSLAPGPKIGELLGLVRDAQLEDQITTKEEALSFVKKVLEESGSVV